MSVEHFWWGEAPEQLYNFDGGAGLLNPNIRLHQNARRAAVYRVNNEKRIGRPSPGSFLDAKRGD